MSRVQSLLLGLSPLLLTILPPVCHFFFDGLGKRLNGQTLATVRTLTRGKCFFQDWRTPTSRRTDVKIEIFLVDFYLLILVALGRCNILEVVELLSNDGHDDFSGLLLGSFFRDRWGKGYVLTSHQLMCAAVDDGGKVSDCLAIARWSIQHFGKEGILIHASSWYPLHPLLHFSVDNTLELECCTALECLLDVAACIHEIRMERAASMLQIYMI